MYSEGSQFARKFLSVLKLVIYKIYFRYQSDFPFPIYESVSNANSKQHLLLARSIPWNRTKTPEITKKAENFIKVTKYLTKIKETLINYV